MPLLPYCILLAGPAADSKPTGIRNSDVQSVRHGRLVAFYSEIERSEVSPQTFQQAALEFHSVVHWFFQQVAVVPFRFPTWLMPQELMSHLQQHTGRYQSFLAQHVSDVQMELRLSLSPNEPNRKTLTGTEHLQGRSAYFRQLRESADRLKQILTAHAVAWRQSERPDGMRLYALVDRGHVEAFRERLSGREQEFSVRLSGPWPATEFLPEPEAG